MRQEAIKTAVSRFAELPILQRSVVILKDVLDESLTEIAALLDLTVDAVKGHLARGRARLREVNAEARQLPDTRTASAAVARRPDQLHPRLPPCPLCRRRRRSGAGGAGAGHPARGRRRRALTTAILSTQLARPRTQPDPGALGMLRPCGGARGSMAVSAAALPVAPPAPAHGAALSPSSWRDQVVRPHSRWPQSRGSIAARCPAC